MGQRQRRLKAKGEDDARCGDPACLPGIDVSLDVFFREAPLAKRLQRGYRTARRGTLLLLLLPLSLFLPAKTMLSHRLLHGQRSCVSRTHRHVHTAITITTGLHREREREIDRRAKGGKKGEGEHTYSLSFSLSRSDSARTEPGAAGEFAVVGEELRRNR